MATVHQLSILTNSCVKPPVNPQSGLSFTAGERGNNDSLYRSDNGDKFATESFQMTNGSVNFDTAHFDTLANQDMTDLPDDVFYQRLVKLKEEHKKTLEMCEQMYTEKLEEQRRVRSRSPSPVYRRTRTPSPVPRGRSPSPAPRARTPSPAIVLRSGTQSPSGSDFMITGTRTTTRDNIRDMSVAAKPPLPKKSSGSPNVRPGSAGAYRSQTWTSRESTSSVEMEPKSPMSVKDYALDHSHNSSRHSAMSKIEDMWENFSVEDYTPRTRSVRKRSNSLSRLSDDNFKSEADNLDKWKHRITIPKPFTMTQREQAKTPSKSRAAIEMEEKRLEKERKEDEECQKKFKARPVPAHVYMPLFDEIMEQQETRRRYNRQKSAELTKSVQKPFKLSTREEEKKQKVKRATQFEEYDDSPTKEFRANPFPEHLFGHTVYDKLAEEEEYRRIRMQMRSQELLRKASLPPTMAARGKDYTDGKSRQKMQAERAKKAGITGEHKFQPRVNDDIPDFDEMHRKFLRELGQRKGEREATVCKPFNLRTAHIPSTKQKIYEDIARDEEELRENRWPFRSARSGRSPYYSGGMSKSLSRSWDSLPAKMTTSAQLRTSANKAKMQATMEAELAALEDERKKRLKSRQLQKEITERALSNDHTTDHSLAKMQKIREHRENEKRQKEEYRRYLNEIQERVEKRPLLFEQTAQENARRAAEKKYASALQRAGLDSEMVESQGSARSRTTSRSTARSITRSPSASRSRSRSPTSHSKSYGTGKYSEDFDENTHGSDMEEELS